MFMALPPLGGTSIAFERKRHRFFDKKESMVSNQKVWCSL